MATAPEQPLVPISKRLVLINSISGIAARILTAGVFLWVIQYLLKRIPEEELALLPIVGSVAFLLPLIQTILTSGLSRHVTEAYSRGDLAGVTRIVSSQLPLLFGGSLVLMVVGGAIAWNIHHVLNVPLSLVPDMRLMLFLVLGRMVVGMILAPFNTGLFAKQQFVRQNMVEVAGAALRAALTLVLILGVGPRTLWVILALVVSQLFVVISTTIMSVRVMPALKFQWSSFDWQTCKHNLAFGGWDFVSQSANVILRATDAPILNLFSTPTAVNSFYLGASIEVQLRDLVVRSTQPLLPALTAMHAAGQPARLGAAFLRTSRIALWASMIPAVPLIVFAHDVFSIYLGNKYNDNSDAATVMILLLIGFPLSRPTLLFSRIAYARGELRPIAIRTVITQIGNLCLTLVFVGALHLGAVGSALATMIAYVVSNPFIFWPLALKTMQITWRRFFDETLLPGLLPSVTAGLVSSFAAHFASTPVTRLAVGVPVSIVVYAITMAMMLRPADLADLRHIRKLIHV
jgi:O-antigen/teichoic acid export membrane protein